MQRKELPERPPLPMAGVMEDYSAPFFVVAGVLTFIALAATWWALGLPMTLAAAFLVDRFLIHR